MNLREIDRLAEETAQRQLVEKDALNRKHVRQMDVIREFRALADAAASNGNGHVPAAITEQTGTDPAGSPPASMPRNDTKKALIISMMERKGGATNAEMVSATGWVINSVRGQVSALRKSGYTITPEKRADGQRAYIVKERQAPSGQR